MRELRWRRERGGEAVLVQWAPAEGSTQDEYRVSYHEAGPSRDDSNALTTPTTEALLEALLPGRNYTVTVAAVSRGVESNESSFGVATRPLAPVVLAAEPAERALRLAWRSDVNSRQDAYELRYRRRAVPPAAPADFLTLETREAEATLPALFPGAVYEIQLAAVSHGLRSERHALLRAVRPLPPLELAVERATSNSVVVRWRGPGAASALGGFLLTYRTQDAAAAALDPLPPDATQAEVSPAPPRPLPPRAAPPRAAHAPLCRRSRT